VLYQDDEFDIVWKEVSEAESILLSSFLEGVTLSDAMEQLAETLPDAVAEAAEQVGHWLQNWLELEFFIRQSTLDHGGVQK
jgi:hypothetical protein